MKFVLIIPNKKKKNSCSRARAKSYNGGTCRHALAISGSLLKTRFLQAHLSRFSDVGVRGIQFPSPLEF